MATEKQSFTPGPWEVDGNAIRQLKESATIALVYKRSHGLNHNGTQKEDEVQHANACLIAKAPDMYAKIIKVAEWLEKSAARSEKQAETCQFRSLKDAYIADAKNYRATAKDMRSALPDFTAPIS